MPTPAIVIRRTQVPAVLGISIATVDRLRANGKFVKPVRLSSQAVGFLLSDIEAWVAARSSAAQ